MVKLKIDNIECEGPEETTILDLAGNLGIKIPTLCHKKGIPHYSSCMVCMVKDRRNDSFIPSCSAIILPGMDIDTCGTEVINLRRKALELLLSEHRAECEAPCRTVCPAGYNIPMMNRLLASGSTDDAEKLSMIQLNTPALWCYNCPGYCENACRRKKIDIPVSIRNLQLFINERTKLNNIPSGKNENKIITDSLQKPVKDNKRFNSFTGKVEASELREWLKECPSDIVRHREITDITIAYEEAESCMHCDCRASDNCSLRDLAESYSIKDPRGKIVNSPVTKKINHKTGLIFENAKCIKCGLCVRLCEDSNDTPALCFLYRGFISIISEALTEDFDNILMTKTSEVIEICPTGALSKFK